MAVTSPVTDVTIEESRASIILSVNFSGSIKDKIEKYRIANFLKKELESELRTVEDTFTRNSIFIVRAEIRDFHTEKLIDLSLVPLQEETATITLCSYSQKIGELVGVIDQFVLNNDQALPLVIEFRPNEGPLFANTEVKIDSTRLNDMRAQLEEHLATDLWGLKGEIIEKIVMQRGFVT